MIKTANKQYKIVLVGDSSVGKSSILNRFVDDTFQDSLLSTIGVDFKFRKINLQGNEIKLQIWDTAGQQIFRSIVSAYYSSADAIIAVYDVSSYQSFQNLKEYWLNEIDNQNRSQAKVFVFGNKTDLPKRQVQTFNLENLMQSFKIEKTYQVSAKNSTGILEAFLDITKILQGVNNLKVQNNVSKQKERQKEKQKQKANKKPEKIEKQANKKYAPEAKKSSSSFFSSFRKSSYDKQKQKPKTKQPENITSQSQPTKQDLKRQQYIRQQPSKPRKMSLQQQKPSIKDNYIIRQEKRQNQIPKSNNRQNISLKKPPNKNVSYSSQCCPT